MEVCFAELVGRWHAVFWVVPSAQHKPFPYTTFLQTQERQYSAIITVTPLCKLLQKLGERPPFTPPVSEMFGHKTAKIRTKKVSTEIQSTRKAKPGN
jgi:hypothetical protein